MSLVNGRIWHLRTVNRKLDKETLKKAKIQARTFLAFLSIINADSDDHESSSSDDDSKKKIME